MKTHNKALHLTAIPLRSIAAGELHRYASKNMKQEILIAIVAASSALCGVIISQTISLLQSFLNKKHEKQKLLRQKYEEMMFHFSSSLQWIQQVNMCRAQQEIFALAQCPDTRKALSLCLLYFPDLAGPANDYLLAQLS